MPSEGAAQENEEEWLKVPSHFSLEDAAKDLRKKYKATIEEVEPEDPIQRKIDQLYRETLKIQKMQNLD